MTVTSASLSTGGCNPRVAVTETVYVEEPDVHPRSGRDLLTDLIVDGVAVPEHLGATGVATARAHHAAAIAELPSAAFGLARGEPVIPTVYI